MGDILFENDVFNILLQRYRENKLAHAFLLETNSLDSCYKDLIKFVKYLSCPYEYNDNCDNDNCHNCELIDSGNLPSFIKVDPDGTLIKKGQIQEIINRFQSIPIFSNYNIYVVNECDKLNSSSANSLLKFLEEPEDNILGFYITTNKMNVISTVRSRCQELNVYYDLAKTDYKYSSVVAEYLNSVYKNEDAILYNKVEALNLLSDRSEWIDFFKEMLYILYSYLKNKSNEFNIRLLNEMSDKEIVKIEDLIKSVLKYLQSNGNIELILDKFVLEMRDLHA